LEAVEVRAGGAVGYVGVGPDEVVRRLLHAPPRECLPVGVVQGAGHGLARQVVDGQRAGAAPTQRGSLTGVPADGAAAQQQLEARGGERLAEPAPPAVAGDAGVGEPVAGPGSPAQPGAAFLDGEAVPGRASSQIALPARG
jgi:hypothetical protein